MKGYFRLGYPPYFALPLGTAQLPGVVAILAPMHRTLREWAYAGLTFDVLRGRRVPVGHRISPGHLSIPFVALAMVLLSYWGWRRRLSGAPQA
jgi:hypothetical protein